MSMFKTNIFKLISSVILLITFMTGCKVVDEIKKELYVKISTGDVTEVYYTAVVVGGNVTDDGGKTITEKGICISTSPNPTTSSTKIQMGIGVGPFSSPIDNLTDNTKYYYRAYCINSYGVAYGEEKSFTTTQANTPSLVTNNAFDVNYNQFSVSLKISSTGGFPITSSGFYYSLNPNVTISDNFIEIPNGFSINTTYSTIIKGLNEGTTYYVAAYAKNGKGIKLGNVITVKTNNSPIKIGLASGLQVFYSFSGNPFDDSGNGFNGTASGVSLTADRFNNSNSAYYFNGQNNSNISTNYSGVLGNSTRSFSFWLKRKDPIGNSVTIFSYGNFGAVGQSINISIGKDATGNLVLFDNGGSAAGTIFNLVDDKWHHYVMIWDKSFGSNVTSIKQYIDGVYKSNNWSYNPNPINTVAGSKLLIGQFDPSKNDWRTFLGSIDELGIWNRVLSSDEIQYLYQNNYRP